MHSTAHSIFVLNCYLFVENLNRSLNINLITRSGNERAGGMGFQVVMTGVQLTHLSGGLSDDSLFSLSQGEEVHLFYPLNMNDVSPLTRNSLASLLLKSVD